MTAWEMRMGRRQGIGRVSYDPRELLKEIAALGDATTAIVVLQVRNLVLIHGGAVENNPQEICRLCGITAKEAEKVIHRIIHRIPECDIYADSQNMLSSHKAERILSERNSVIDGKKKGKSIYPNYKNTSEQNQRVKNHDMVNKSILPNYKNTSEQNQRVKNHADTGTIPLLLNNNIYTTARARGGKVDGLAGVRSAGSVVQGMMQAVRCLYLSMGDLDIAHLKAMLELYPDTPRDELLALFNAWVAREAERGMVVHHPRAMLMAWLKKSTWINFERRNGHAEH